MIFIQLLDIGLRGVRLTQQLSLPFFENPALIGDLKSILDKLPNHGPHLQKLIITQSDFFFEI